MSSVTCKTCGNTWDRQTYICCPRCFRIAVRIAAITRTLELTREAQRESNQRAIDQSL